MYWRCVYSLSYPERNAHPLYYTVICVLSDCTIFVHIISHTARFSGENFQWTQNVCFDFFYYFCLKSFSSQEKRREIWSQMCTVLHVNFSLLSLYKSLIFSTDFRKILKYESSWKSIQRELSCSVQTDRQTNRKTDLIKLIASFSNFSNGWLVVSWSVEF